MMGTYGLEAVNRKLKRLTRELDEARARIAKLEEHHEDELLGSYPDEDHLDEAQPPVSLERFREP